MQRQNFVVFTVFVVIFIQKDPGLVFFEPTNFTTPNLIREACYPVEEHEVTTDDGYILTLHRIPYSPNQGNCSSEEPLPVVFLQHGLISCSTDWIGLGPPDALGYLLSDKGFDIWMGNSRGNRYSQKHIEKDSNFPPYWDFSWHEMGVYDLPAVFDYISKETGVDQFHYIALSQGGTEFLVYCSINILCSKKIKAAHLFAPIAFTKNFQIPYASILGAILGQPDALVKIIGSFNPVPNTEILHKIGQFLCNDYSYLQFLCADIIKFIMGPSDYLNESMIPFLLGVYPAGSSFKQFQHYNQNFNSGKFRQFDNGALFNLRLYGSLTPPDYDFNKILAPIYLYYAENDVFATPKDIFNLIKLLPEGVVRKVYRMPLKKWSHMDFIYGMNVKTLLYDEVLKNLR